MNCIPVPGRTQRGEHLGTIPGLVPSLVGEMPGCHFAGRCAHAIDACRQAKVPLAPGPDAGHLVRCLRADEIAGTASRTAAQVAS
jgi:peptide/nickel transport system ATP-binding protein